MMFSNSRVQIATVSLSILDTAVSYIRSGPSGMKDTPKRTLGYASVVKLRMPQ